MAICQVIEIGSWSRIVSISGWKVIKPKKLKAAAMIREMEKPVIETIDSADKEFAKTYKTWEHKPTFKKVLKVSKREIVGSTTTTEKGDSDNPYPFVTRGTKVRRAIMTSNFSPKTRAGVLGSGGGRGGVLFISKKVNRPGIKRRDFEPLVTKLEEPKFRKRISKAIKRAAKVSGQTI